eukprot:c38798_g1_i1.p1 GENE.c38798_g1_i1~~c38798_g1_i1.p1  ORF type:complete len:221 (+),score=45.93 c38798_g1_i1:31-663(+)
MVARISFLVLVSLAVICASPVLYSSVDEARRAAEEELSKLGELIDTSEPVSAKAETEALKLVTEAEKNPMHQDLYGATVDLGAIDDPADRVAPETATSEHKAAPKLELPVNKNEQSKTQVSEADIPMAHRATGTHGASHGTRPVPQFFGQMPQFQPALFGQMGAQIPQPMQFMQMMQPQIQAMLKALPQLPGLPNYQNNWMFPVIPPPQA